MYSTTLYRNSGYCAQDSSLYANKFLVSSSSPRQNVEMRYVFFGMLVGGNTEHTGPPAGRKFGLAVLIDKSSTSTPVISRLLI